MAFLQNPVQRTAPATQAGLMRQLLECRFDFQHKLWNLPSTQFESGGNPDKPAGQDVLLPLLSKIISDFSDPTLGGQSSRRIKSNRIGIRRLAKQFAGKQLNQKGEK